VSSLKEKAKIKWLPRRCYTCKYYKDEMCFCPVKDTVALVDEIETSTGVQTIPEGKVFDEFGVPRPEYLVLIAIPNPTRMCKILGERGLCVGYSKRVLAEYANDLEISIGLVEQLFAVMKSLGWTVANRGTYGWRQSRVFIRMLAKLIEKGALDVREIEAMVIMAGRSWEDTQKIIEGLTMAGVASLEHPKYKNIKGDEKILKGGVLHFLGILKKRELER
jgi:hypothetical protein